MFRLLVFAVCAVSAAPSFAQPTASLVSVRKIWDRAPHNAFTDLIRFEDRWFCVFREGQSHVSSDGALRVITSPDGIDWESAALIESPNSDLRDAKITITPDNRLMLSGAAAINEPVEYTHQSLIWFSEDGRNWSKPHEVADRDFWLWRINWHQSVAWGFGYGTRPDNRSIRLYSSVDGMDFRIVVAKAFGEGYPNETAVVFRPDETCLCLLRRDGEQPTAQLGIARPPYEDWHWQDLGVRIGGPQMIQIPDGRLLAVVRLYDEATRTALCLVDPDAGSVREFLTLPSGGDTSYAGMVWHDDRLWISYYSSHEGRASVYLAQVEMDP